MERFNRAEQDVGYIVAMEHVNIRVSDPRVTTIFYAEGLGLTRDPYMNVTDNNMWMNAGRNQFHLPTNAKPQVVRGTIGLVVPSLADLRQRLERVAPKLASTKFSWRDEGDNVLATCPYGNRIRAHEAGSAFKSMTLGIPYVDFAIPRGAAEGIARFYRDVLKNPAWVEKSESGAVARTRIGINQHLLFSETDDVIAVYDGHHIAIYVGNFFEAYSWLAERGLVTEETDPYQYRFQALVDPRTERELFQLEHEVRSFTHPMFQRQWSLVNRNPERDRSAYVAGRDAYYPGHK